MRCHIGLLRDIVIAAGWCLLFFTDESGLAGFSSFFLFHLFCHFLSDCQEMVEHKGS
jgi:hypothetical protein